MSRVSISLVELARLQGCGYRLLRFGPWDLYVRVLLANVGRKSQSLKIDILPPELARLAKPLPKKIGADPQLYEWNQDPLFEEQLRAFLLDHSYSFDEPKTFEVDGMNEVIGKRTR